MTVDTLITKYVLDSKGYEEGAAKVARSTKATGTALKANQGHLDGMASGLRAAGSALGMAVAVASAAGVAMAGFGIAAMKAAANFDTMERTFAGALGSMDLGRQMMKGLEAYATKSAFSLEALTQASVQLAASGLDVKTYLPVLERFALVISGVDPSGLEQVAGALARAKGGAFGEAMESFRRAGVGANDFRAKGIGISKGGEVQATAEQFLAAIVGISEGKLKTMADSISGGAETQLSNLSDVMAQAFRTVGKELNDAFLPTVVGLTEQVKMLVDSGVVKMVADNFIELGKTIFGNGKGSLEDAAFEAAVALGSIPVALAKFGESLGKIAMLNPFFHLVNAASKKFNGKDIGSATADVFGITEFRMTAESARAAYLKDRNNKPEAGIPTVPGLMGTGGIQGAGVQYLQEIAQNTKATVDLQRMAFGGGPIGSMGVSAVERSGMVIGGDGADAMLVEAARLIRKAMGVEMASSRRRFAGA